MNNQYLIFIKDYWVQILAIIGVILFILKYFFGLVKKINKIDPMEENMKELGKNTNFIKGKVSTIEKLLKGGIQFAGQYGERHSPVVLKDEFNEFIKESKLDIQIENKSQKLLDWLKSQEPKTGLDAQDDIANFVISGEVSEYLDLIKYKQYLYQKGKTSQDANGILAIYLYEVLIPKLNFINEKGENEK